MDCIQGNKLIKVFMASHGDEYCLKNINNDIDMFYHSSWNSLMPVVEKIESLGFKFFIYNEIAEIKRPHWEGNCPDFCVKRTTKIKSAYKMIIRFIQWYSTTKNS
jgi:hypothetical protein